MHEPTEIVDVTNKVCCICLDDFNNNAVVMVLACAGHHVLCVNCESRLREQDDPSRSRTCPLCRETTDVSTIGISQNYYAGSGSTTATAITID